MSVVAQDTVNEFAVTVESVVQTNCAGFETRPS